MILNRRALIFFGRMGMGQATSEWALIAVRIPLFLTMISMWAYTWSMVPEDLWERLSLDWTHLVWYITLTEIVIFFSGHSHRDIERDVWEKKFETHLTRPCGWLGLFSAFEMGRIPFNFLMMGMAGVAFALVATHTFPLSFLQILEVIIHMILGSWIWISLLAMVGLSTLWLRSAGLCYWITQKSGFILGGLLLPLTFYPAWLKILAFLTPFPAVFYIPGQVVLPHSPFDFQEALLYQITVLLVVRGLVLLMWNRFEHKLLREG